jgi:hypothetical protein
LRSDSQPKPHSATVETSGTYDGVYDLFVAGFGFWATGNQGQGGINEPFANWHISAGPLTLLSPIGAATYLIAVDCSDGATGTLQWTDEIGPQTASIGPTLSGALIPVHVAAAGSLVFTTGSCYLSAADMKTPKAGTGPLIDYEVNLLNYTDVKWPKYVNVVPGGPTTTYVFAGNIARVPGFTGPVLKCLATT